MDLQAQRHEADYDPTRLLRTLTVIRAIALARQAVVQSNQTESEERRAFLTLLAFKQRK